jgi:hypothetical protein
VRPLTAGAANVAHDRTTGVNGHTSQKLPIVLWNNTFRHQERAVKCKSCGHEAGFFNLKKGLCKSCRQQTPTETGVVDKQMVDYTLSKVIFADKTYEGRAGVFQKISDFCVKEPEMFWDMFDRYHKAGFSTQQASEHIVEFAKLCVDAYIRIAEGAETGRDAGLPSIDEYPNGPATKVQYFVLSDGVRGLHMQLAAHGNDRDYPLWQ